MEYTQIFGSFIAILILGMIAFGLFKSKPVTADRIHNFLSYHLPNINLDQVIIDQDQSSAIITEKTTRKVYTILQLGDRLAMREFNKQSIIDFSWDKQQLNIRFHDITYPVFNKTFAPIHADAIQKIADEIGGINAN